LSSFDAGKGEDWRDVSGVTVVHRCGLPNPRTRMQVQLVLAGRCVTSRQLGHVRAPKFLTRVRHVSEA